MVDNENVKVFCRVRPTVKHEDRDSNHPIPSFFSRSACFNSRKCISIPTTDPLQKTIILYLKSQPNIPKTFTFDRVFHEDTLQEDVFKVVGVPLTRACLQGYNGTIFAYGQTGSGKTYTMQGPEDRIWVDSEMPRSCSLRGLVPRVFEYLFDEKALSESPMKTPSNSAESYPMTQHTFSCSFLEIYNERVYDLLDARGSSNGQLNGGGLQLRENGRRGVFVEGLIESVVENANQAAALMKLGAQNRRVGQTAMNRESSRSHSVFILDIRTKHTNANGIISTKMSRFNLVDLAGSERQKLTEAAGDRLKEAGSINKSLSALGNVIMGLVDKSAGKSRHVHYRDSKLTFLLKDSLGGNSKTFMIATVSPGDDCSNETLSTLKFAQRAKSIRNDAIVNEDTSGSVAVLQQEIQRLKSQLQLQSSQDKVPRTFLREKELTEFMSEPCDTQTETLENGDERTYQLEDTLAQTIEEHILLKETNAQLKASKERFLHLYEKTKERLTHARLMLRLANSAQAKDGCTESIANEIMYEPSLDAIEWRVKFEELEDAYLELCERLKQHEYPNKDLQSELDRLHNMYYALSKHFANMVIEKRKMLKEQTQDKVDDPRIQEYEAKLCAINKVQASLVEKANTCCVELLQSKQREAAFVVKQIEIERKGKELEAINIQEMRTREESEALLLAEKNKVQILIAEQNRKNLKQELLLSNEKEINQRLGTHVQALDLGHDKLTDENERLQLSLNLCQSDIEKERAQLRELTASLSAEKSRADSFQAKYDQANALHAMELEDATNRLRFEVLAREERLCTLERVNKQLLDELTAIREQDGIKKRQLIDAAENISELETRLHEASTTALNSSQALSALEMEHSKALQQLAQVKDQANAQRLAFHAFIASDAKELKYLSEAQESAQDTISSRVKELETRLTAVCERMCSLKTVSENIKRKLFGQILKNEKQILELRESYALLSADTDERLRLEKETSLGKVKRLEELHFIEISKLSKEVYAHREKSTLTQRELAAVELRYTQEMCQLKSERESALADLHCAIQRGNEANHRRKETLLLASEEIIALRHLHKAHMHSKEVEITSILNRSELEKEALIAVSKRLEMELSQTHASLDAHQILVENAKKGIADVLRDSNEERVLEKAEEGLHCAVQRLKIRADAILERTKVELEMKDKQLNSIRTEYNDTLSELKGEIQSEREQRKAITRERDRTQAEFDRKAKIAEKLHTELAASLSKQKSMTDEYEGQLIAARKQLAHSENRCKKAQREMDRTESLILRLENQLISVQYMRDLACEDAAASQLARQAFSHANTALKNQLEEERRRAEKQMACLLSDHDKTLLDIRTALESEHADAIQKYREEWSACKTEHSQHQELLESLRCRAEDLESHAFAHIQDSTVRKQRKAQRKLKKEGLCAREKEIKANEANRADLERECAQLRTQLKQMTSRFKRLQLEHDALELDAKKWRKRTAGLTGQLENMGKEMNKLVTHGNTRQKIQHHIKVKEENNRLVDQLRLLNEEKIKLLRRIGKLKQARREDIDSSTDSSSEDKSQSSVHHKKQKTG